MTFREPKIALLLSGGAGTRLWPVSTEERPKQFMPLFGAQSLFQKTLRRLRAASFDEIWVVTNRRHAEIAKDQAVEIGEELAACLLEPERRDSAAAIAAGVQAIAERHGKDALVTVLPCDHLIPSEEAFAEALAAGFDLARLGWLGTFGIAPTFPSSEFGYIQRGARIDGHAEAFEVGKFHEKPGVEKAREYIAHGDFSWNSGMFAFKTDVFAREAMTHMPDIWAAAGKTVAASRWDGNVMELDPEAFSAIRKISIDFGLFEVSSAVGMVPGRFEWLDVGNWATALGALDRDAAGNAAVGDVTMLDTSGSLIIGDGVRVLTAGLEKMIVVATPKGVFVAPLSRAVEVKKLLEKG
ncbi:MAG: mannose-1-phosphate guanylyltransferase [Beijerinckiaceae bacterium]